MGRVQRGRLLRRRGLWRLGQVDDSLRGVAEEQPRHAAVPAVLGHGKQCCFQHLNLGVDRHDRRFERGGPFPQDLRVDINQ